MNKKIIWFGLMFFLFFSFAYVLAQDPSNSNANEEDVNTIKGYVENYTPLNESGELDTNRFKPFKSKAEERIEEIDKWFEEKAPWLKIFFGIVPEISWLFMWSVYFWLLLFVVFVLNGGNIFSFLSKGKAQMAGLGLFVILVVIKLNYLIAKGLVYVIGVVWSVILPLGLIIAVLAMIIIGFGFGWVLSFSQKIINLIMKKWRGRQEKKQTELDRKILHAEVEGMTGG